MSRVISLDDPLLEVRREEVEALIGDLAGDDVAPVEAPMLGEFVGGQQLVDQLGALVRALVGNELGDVGGHRQPAGQIEPDSADELLVGGALRRFDVGFLQLTVDEPVELGRRQGRRGGFHPVFMAQIARGIDDDALLGRRRRFFLRRIGLCRNRGCRQHRGQPCGHPNRTDPARGEEMHVRLSLERQESGLAGVQW
jgi:hypothetical protein